MPSDPKSEPKQAADSPEAGLRMIARPFLIGLVLVTLLGVAVWGLTIGDEATPNVRSSVQKGEQSRRLDGARPVIAVHSSLPLYWPQSSGFDEILSPDAEPPWPRQILSQRFRPEPLDTLDDLLDTNSGIATQNTNTRLSYVIVAQPRALTPSDNVALDSWVRGGGHLLLILDPLLLAQSPFPLGDARAPQATALVPPILPRWGLDMAWDERQAQDWQRVRMDGGGIATVLPVRSHGTLSWHGENAGEARCELFASAIAARCEVGKGVAIIIADADFLTANESDPLPQAKSTLDELGAMLIVSPTN